jgi:predicted enzyme related to lactoylglutathione lyase
LLFSTTLWLCCCDHALAGKGPQLPPLTTVSGNPRIPGKFVWADLVTDDVVAARNFYSAMFGWTFSSMGNYLIARNDGRPVAGVFQAEKPKDRPDARPRWFGYISVPNVERAQNEAIKAGGRFVAPPKEMPKRGEQAVFADPEGALCGVIRSSSGDPEDFLPEPGDWIWMQLMSRDGRKAADFYRRIAGYDIVENTNPAGLSDLILMSKGYARATVRTIRKDPEKVRPTWLPFVRVKSVTSAMADVNRLGGKVLLAPSPELFGGKLAVVADPTGAEVGVMEWSADMLKGAR